MSPRVLAHAIRGAAIVLAGCGRLAGDGPAAPVQQEDAAPAAPVEWVNMDAGATPAPPWCEPNAYTLTPLAARPVSMMLVVEASSALSPTDPPPGSSLKPWSAIADGIRAFTSALVLANRNDVSVGLIVYGDSLDPVATSATGTYPSTVDIPIARLDAVHASAMDARLAGAPGGAAQAHRALAGAYASFPATNDVRVVEWIQSSTPTELVERVRIQHAVAQAHGAGIETSLLGVGADPARNDSHFLGEIVSDGGGLYTSGGIVDTAALSSAALRDVIASKLNEAMVQARGPCLLTLPPGAPEEGPGGYLFSWHAAGAPMPRFEASAVRFGNVVKLLGQTCVDYLAKGGEVTAAFQCPSDRGLRAP